MESSCLWPGSLYCYESAAVALIFFFLRAAKVTVLHVLFECTLCLFNIGRNTSIPRANSSRLDVIYQQLRAAADDICAVVPFSLNVDWPDLPEDLSHLRAIRVSKAMEGVDDPSVMMHFFSCIEVLPDLQRRWLRGRNKHIADTYGLPYARAFATRTFPGLLFENGDPGHLLAHSRLFDGSAVS